MQVAEAAGFDAAMCSDHWAPWSDEQGESGFAWSWLGAALEATSLSLGVVNAPGQRYHPAIIAQAAATLGVMYPDRFWVALGSGQLLNEHITGEPWPIKSERNERLREAADVMRRLWAGETVTHSGHVTVSEARLWTRPERSPLLVGAAVTPETAGWVGEWADALITILQPDETSDLLHVKHFRLSAVLRAWEVERRRVSFAVTVSAGPGGGPPPRLPIHRRPAPAPHQLQVDARMLAPLKASPSQPTGKAAKRQRADIVAASEAVSLGMLRLVEQDVAGAGQLERRREPKPMSSTPPENSAPCPPAQPSLPRRHRTSARSNVTWVGVGRASYVSGRGMDSHLARPGLEDEPVRR